MKKLLSLLMGFSISVFLFAFIQQSNVSYISGINPLVDNTYAISRADRDFCDENPTEDGCEEWEPPVIPVSGECATYSDSYIIQPGQNTRNGCNIGTYQNASDSASEWKWTCQGANGGTDATCTAAKSTNNCTTGSEASYRTQQRTTCDSMNNSLPYCSDISGAEGTSGDCITRLEQSRVTVPLSPVRYEDVWVGGRLQTVANKRGSIDWRAAHTKLCRDNGYTKKTQTTNICKSDENSSGTGDYRKWDSDSGRCYNNGQREDDDGSDKDTHWLCERTISEETVNQCESYKVNYNCPAAPICNAGEVDPVTPRSCPTGYTGEETGTRTCNSDGSAWGATVWDDSSCVEETTSVCTANETESGSTRACPAGYTGDETSSRTCNSDGSAWGDYVWDDSSCVENVCTPNEIETGTQACPTGYTGDETNERSCNSTGTAWGAWSAWNTSGCLANACTANEVATESVACGSGFVGDQTRTNTCNSDGTAWLGWTEYDRSSCEAVVCSANEVENETQTCPTGYTGDETRNRTCNNIGTQWGEWTAWDDSGCLENACTPNEEDTQSIACGTGYTGNQTRTNTCNGDGTAWLGWTEYDRSACVEAIDPTGTVNYSPAGPAWTTSNVTVSITCEDNESGCDMVSSFPASWTYVDANTRSYTYPANMTSSIVLYDNAGNSTFIPFGIDYIDKSTPGAPTITADDRSDDEWLDDNTTVLTTTVNSTGEVSPRYNQYCMDSTNTCNPNTTTQPSTSNLSDGTYYYRARTCTSAGRCGPVSVFTLKIDSTDPVASDISVVPGMSGPLLANNNQNFQVTAGNAGGSDIVSIEGFFEDFATTNSYLTNPEISSGDVLSFNRSTEAVDNDRQAAGYRSYQLYIYEVCDEAGNCTREIDADGIRTFTYRVYANTTALGVASVITNELDDTSNIADGSNKNLILTLEDIYGNDIVPATGIGRNISFDFNTNNSLYLNQYTRSGTSALYNNSNTWPIGNNLSRTFTNQSSSDGTYDFTFSAYTPTYQYTQADPSGRFDIQSIRANISGSIGAVSNVNISASDIETRFAPLYTTSFGGELDNNGFIEGAQQSSDLSVTKAASSVTPSTRNLSVQYGGQTDNLRLDISRSGNPTTAVSETSRTELENNFGNTTYPFNTLLTQEGGTIEDISETFLSSHISYTLDGQSILYNGDVIGKSNYHDADIDNTTSQSGIKVVGLTSSERTTALTNDQFTDDVTILGKLTKSTSRKDIQASVFSVIKNVDPTSNNGSSPSIDRLDTDTWSNNSDGTKLVNSSVLYFGGLSGDDVELGNGSNEVIGGKKTIVVEGGNLYIRSNTSYADAGNDILGIVVLQDEDGNGGNLYIHPDVTNIVGTIYVDKSVISYNGTSELDGNTQASVLNNQLYIFGSLFSENTIGGSRSNPLECPYYISVCSSTVEAQKYDLNYLRRYFVADTNDDGVKDTPSGNTVFNPSDNYYEYPVVVEYNSRIQSSPPPLFD